jgi:hypothetical protein
MRVRVKVRRPAQPRLLLYHTPVSYTRSHSHSHLVPLSLYTPYLYPSFRAVLVLYLYSLTVYLSLVNGLSLSLIFAFFRLDQSIINNLLRIRAPPSLSIYIFDHTIYPGTTSTTQTTVGVSTLILFIGNSTLLHVGIRRYTSPYVGLYIPIYSTSPHPYLHIHAPDVQPHCYQASRPPRPLPRPRPGNQGPGRM